MKYKIKNASISLDGNPLLNSINMDITDNSHIGIVGKNGAGKTTLLKALIHNEMFEEGIEDVPFEINKIGHFTIGYLEQIVFQNEEISLVEEMKNSFSEILKLEKKVELLNKKMEENPSLENINEYTTNLEHFEALGGYSYQKEYETMLKKFGFTERDKNKKISSFSGGERTKIAFLKLLLSKYDLLFLDEPTNHLDIEAIVWLENYLKKYKGAFVVVSHDRMFLNNIVNTIYAISNGEVKKYIGDYESYEKQKISNYEKQCKDYERQQKEIKRLTALYEKFRSKPTKASMALSKLHLLEKMDVMEQPRRMQEKSFKMNLNKMEPSGKIVLTCKNLKFGYDKALATLDFEINQGKKIGIIGANGSGKSTFLKTIYGSLKPLEGTITYGYHVNSAYFDQNLECLNSQNTILEELKEAYPDAYEKEIRSTLGAFLFSGEDVNKKIEVLSGGEKVRLELCKILYSKPNFLILDEPTNHMDLVSKEQLEKILSFYKGTILFVSHDRYFVKKLAEELLVFTNDHVDIYPYGYDEYIEKSKKQETEKDLSKIEKKKEPKIKKKIEEEDKKELKKLEKELKMLEEKKNKQKEELYNPENFTNYKKMNEVKEELAKTEKDLQRIEEEWEKVAEKLL